MADQDSVAIYNDVISIVTAVLNIVDDDKHLVLILPYDGTKPNTIRGTLLSKSLCSKLGLDQAPCMGLKARDLTPFQLNALGLGPFWIHPHYRILY